MKIIREIFEQQNKTVSFWIWCKSMLSRLHPCTSLWIFIVSEMEFPSFSIISSKENFIRQTLTQKSFIYTVYGQQYSVHFSQY